MRIVPGALLLLAAGCGGGSTDLITPPPPPPAGFRIQVQPDPEDAATAQALGWSQGIPSADVTLTLRESSSAGQTIRTDATGLADFGAVAAGDYNLQISRWLSAGERAQLPASDDANGWVGGQEVRVSGSAVQEISAFASHRKALLISEWSFDVPFQLSLGDYQYGGYLELANNSDTTIYLDGVIIGEGWRVSADYPNFPCSMYDSFTRDRQGVWARFFQRFPGSGREHPLTPGARAIIATDAIDHRPFYPGTLDLRSADFEFSGLADADNPDVPSLEEIGTITNSVGHGLIFPGPTPVAFVAQPMELAALHYGKAPGSDDTWARFPNSMILDFMSVAPYPNSSGYAECSIHVSPHLDRRPSRARLRAGQGSSIGHEAFSLQRRVTGIDPQVFQHSRNSDLDFVFDRRRWSNP